MVTETMNYKEVVSQFYQDWHDELCERVKKLSEDNKYRRYILKQNNNKRIFFNPIEITSRQRNKYILRFCCKGKTEYKKVGLPFILYMYYHTSKGIYIVVCVPMKSHGIKNHLFTIYTPHFFDRYRERFLKDAHINKIQLINNFLCHNTGAQCLDIENKKYPNSVFCSIPDGAILATRYNDYILENKTYLTNEQLKEDQLPTYERLSQRLDLNIENIKPLPINPIINF